MKAKKILISGLVATMVLSTSITAFASEDIKVEGVTIEIADEDRGVSISEDERIVAIDDISYVTGNQYIDARFDEIIANIRGMKNSGVSEEELNAYANELLSDDEFQDERSILYDLDGYITNRLNSQEQQLYNSNVAYGLLCMANGKFATDYANSNYKSSVLHNGNGDAFRHVLWNYGMACDVGSSFAKKWSDAHEYGTSGQPQIERTMDLYNNSVGLNLAKTYPGTVLHSTFIKNAKDKVSNGQCYRISNNTLYWSNSVGLK